MIDPSFHPIGNCTAGSRNQAANAIHHVAAHSLSVIVQVRGTVGTVKCGYHYRQPQVHFTTKHDGRHAFAYCSKSWHCSQTAPDVTATFLVRECFAISTVDSPAGAASRTLAYSNGQAVTRVGRYDM